MPESNVTNLPPRCGHCRQPRANLYDTFVNSAGWLRLCASCGDPDRFGLPRAYTGPYPITAKRLPHLHVVGEAQG